MGFFKKIFKGVKKVFKKIGSGIKKTVKKVGKFMGKLGIVGQIGLGLILPGIGTMMGSMFGQLAGALSASSIGIVKGAGQLINAAVNIGTKAGNVFSTITEGVGKVLGEVTGATLNKLGVKQIGTVSLQDKGFASIWDTTQKAFSDVAAQGKDLFSMDTLTADNIFMKKAEQVATDAIVDAPAELVEKQTVDYTKYDPATGGSYVDTTAPTVDYATYDPATGGEYVDTTTQAAAPKPSLLSRATEGAKETIAKAPSRLGEALIQNVAAIPRDAVRGLMTGDPEVTYNVSQAYVADLPYGASIGQELAQPAFDIASFVDQNQSFINTNPYGFSARLYNDATYQRNMASYGFTLPQFQAVG